MVWTRSELAAGRSFFLLVSALLLTALFFRLGVEQRLREIGLYQALGFDRAAVSRVFLREGILLGIAGSVLGIFLGIGYSAFILYALRTWWVDAVGTTSLTLHFAPGPFTAAVFQGVVIAVIIITVSLRRLRKMSPRQLLSGARPETVLKTPRWLRVAALLLTIPLLTFVATVAGLMGGAMVTWSMLGLGPSFFMTRLVESVGATHFWIALSKAPVMAIAIAGIGCRQGMLVEGDVLSLGQRVTAAVVQAIFAIILIDAIFAMIYMELDL